VDVATPAVQKMKRMATDSGTYSWQEGASVICEHLATGKKLMIATEHTLHVTEIIEAARKSQETGQRIKINSTFNYEVLLKSHYE
jgi:NAD-dependent oxidoreductase involved in siderophore biosynthesis